MSPDDGVELPVCSPAIAGNWRCLPSGRRLKQSGSQPDRIFLMEAQRLPKHPSLVPATGVRRAEAILLRLPDIENRPVTFSRCVIISGTMARCIAIRQCGFASTSYDN